MNTAYLKADIQQIPQLSILAHLWRVSAYAYDYFYYVLCPGSAPEGRLVAQPHLRCHKWHYKLSEKARAPYTNGPRDVPGVGICVYYRSRYTTRGGDFGAQAIDRGGARCASQVFDHGTQAVARSAARFALQVLGRGTQAGAAAPRMYLIVVYRPLPAKPFVVCCMYMAVVPGPMLAAVALRCCR
jgi:hypothetical protein